MGTRLKRRLAAVSGIIVMVLIVILAVVGSATAAKTVTVAEAARLSASDEKIQVTGNVVTNSFSIEDGMLVFRIYDAADDEGLQLAVSYAGAASATFGNDVTAICTGKIDSEGVLVCSQLVTKCPSKYENATGALSVAELFEYGDKIIDKTVKVCGIVKPDTLQPAGGDRRFVLYDDAEGGTESGTDAEAAGDADAVGDAEAAGDADAAGGTESEAQGDVADGATEMDVAFDGALSDDIADSSRVVLTGSLNASGVFVASNVALEG